MSTRNTKQQQDKATHNRTREDARKLRPFLRIVRKGKRKPNNTPTTSHKAKKTRQRAVKQARQEAKQESRTNAGQEDNRRKRKAKHATSL